LGEGPPNFWTWIIKFRQFPTMWPSFRAIGRGTSEKAWRNKKKKKEKTSRAFYKSSRTTVTGGLTRLMSRKGNTEKEMFQPTTERVNRLTIDDVAGQAVPESGTGRAE